MLKNDNVHKQTIIHGDSNCKHCITKYEIDTETIVLVKEHKFFFNDLKDMKLPKEFVSDVHYGENFKTLCNIMITEEVISLERIQQFIEILTGGMLNVSQGSLVNWMHEKAKLCKNIVKEFFLEKLQISLFISYVFVVKLFIGKPPIFLFSNLFFSQLNYIKKRGFFLIFYFIKIFLFLLYF